jgi:hypothetical protein
VTRRARRAAAACAVAVAVTLEACGGPRPADLFILERSGSTPHARLTLLVDEQGGVHCNGGPTRHLSDAALVQARAITEELHSAASANLKLAAAPGSVFAYRLRDADGSVSFADNSPGQPKVLHNLALFVLQTTQLVCGLPE